jgi:hypothetical protein
MQKYAARSRIAVVDEPGPVARLPSPRGRLPHPRAVVADPAGARMNTHCRIGRIGLTVHFPIAIRDLRFLRARPHEIIKKSNRADHVGLLLVIAGLMKWPSAKCATRPNPCAAASDRAWVSDEASMMTTPPLRNVSHHVINPCAVAVPAASSACCRTSWDWIEGLQYAQPDDHKR